MRACRCCWLLLLFCWTTLVWGQKTPEETLKTLRPAPGMDVQLFASEPMITNPSCIDVDAHGRVWVAEIQWYRKAVKDPPADKIKVLEDTDGDGVADKATVFVDGLYAPMSVCVAGNKVYAFIKGELLCWTDANGDLKADGPPEKILTGFSTQNHDHTAHSIMIGPDHKWYMAHGDTGFNVTGKDGSKIESKWGAMIRGELDGTKLEILAHNFRNPYEMTVNSFGVGFCSDNDNDGNQSTRVCWLLEGGDYGWFGGPPFNKNQLDERVPVGTPYREHWHFRGYQPGYVPATVQTGFGSPCGMCFYEGDAFGPALKNVPLHCDPGPREVRAYPHKNAGFGMTGTQENLLTTQGDNYFRPDDICVAPDGSLLVSDWYDGGVGGHAFNDPNRGRIYRLTPTGKTLKSPTKPGPYATIDEAIAGLRSVNLDTQFQARERLLAEGAKSIPALVKLLDDAEPNMRARAMWLLDRIGGDATTHVAKQLKSTDENFRALAVRILGRHGARHCQEIIPLAADPSGLVAREALLALRHVTPEYRVFGLCKRAILDAMAKYDGTDRYQLEVLHVAAGKNGPALAQELIKSKDFKAVHFPLLQLLDSKLANELLVKQLSDPNTEASLALQLIEVAGRQTDVAAGQTLLKVISNEASPAKLRTRALELIATNISSTWKDLNKDQSFKQNMLTLLQSPVLELRVATINLIGQASWTEATPALMKLIADAQANYELRKKAVETAVSLRGEAVNKGLQQALPSAQGELRTAIIKGLIKLQDTKAIREILAAKNGNEDEAVMIIEQSLQTSGGALGLLKLVDEKSIPPRAIKTILGLAVKHPDSSVRVLYEKFIPAEQLEKKLGDAIKADDILKLSGNLDRGKKIFMQSSSAQCKNCHMVDGVGVDLGPDLSLIGKKYERAALLETILFPSKAISHGYETYLLETVQGQTYVGFKVDENDQQVTLKDGQNQLIRVPKSDVEALVKQDRSLMPELVLKDVTSQDAADLLAYLTSLTKGSHAVSSFQLLGPFNGKQFGMDQAHPAEAQATAPDLKKTWDGMNKNKVAWEVVTSDGKLGFPGIDTVKYDNKKGQKAEFVTHFALVYVESLTDQSVDLLVSSDDSCQVWLNGESIHKNNSTRALSFAQDTVATKLKRGRNVILMKVVNGNVPGGFALGVKSSEPVTFKTE
jgi:putative membrane-bound dehydrogenase-like protein